MPFGLLTRLSDTLSNFRTSLFIAESGVKIAAKTSGSLLLPGSSFISAARLWSDLLSLFWFGVKLVGSERNHVVPFVQTGSALSQIYRALPFKGGQTNSLFPLPSIGIRCRIPDHGWKAQS